MRPERYRRMDDYQRGCALSRLDIVCLREPFVRLRTGCNKGPKPYADFDDQAHPALRHSVRVLLPLASYSVRDYSASLNPPILHRKETLVDVLYPYHPVFSDLSAQEAASGLLARSDIGTKQAWLALLAESKLTIIGHQLVPTSDA